MGKCFCQKCGSDYLKKWLPQRVKIGTPRPLFVGIINPRLSQVGDF